ncbi:hypothetical protein BE221DRAFT_146466 [Ostreococcus tauri]|uniref:Uncharacterized protein n=1 Tax=Ostreococcus tauri TaxID=70448 RepID=A0A1Y5IC21_OSTTA|nr:hypothetical protein BE221DRAFT_146464 [Ostreococcus tauri]OUS45594.1 hypothetical protein BE221DRAFT_146466 [Ostreococcus tauri]
MAKRLRNARRANAHSAAREGRLVFTPAMVTFSECAGFYTAEALDLGSRVFGWDREFDSLRASHVTCGVDPDARGAAVAIKIDFSITDAVEQATIVSADVLRPDKRGTIVNGASVFQSSSFFGIHQFEDVTCDSLIERGTKMGNLKAGMAMGAWFGAICATQARFPYARNYHTCEFVDATTWTHGLFGKNAPSKRDRCSIITSWLPLLEPEMRDLRAADREGVADAALIGIYALARVRADLAVSCFPQRPIGVPDFEFFREVDTYSTLVVEELKSMLRSAGVLIPRGATTRDAILDVVHDALE